MFEDELLTSATFFKDNDATKLRQVRKSDMV